MEELKIYTRDEINTLTRKRKDETKIGQMVQVAGSDLRKSLPASTAQFVMLGIPEDIGVRANFGRPGAATAFKPTLDSFLNQQSNAFMTGDEVLLLGELKVDDLMQAAQNLDPRDPDGLARLRALVQAVDQRLIPVITLIVQSGKIPLIIGGGHNNAFGNISGTAQALGKAVNVINCDPHLDFRPQEGRHSGNGFSYAWRETTLAKYAVLGMHEQYNNLASLNEFRDHADRLFYRSYESVFIRGENDFMSSVEQCIGFVKDNACGLELDLDAITNVPASAKTSSGISPVEARQFVHRCAQALQPVYFHIAEGAPVLSHIKADNKTGKLIAYLLSDFIKAMRSTV